MQDDLQEQTRSHAAAQTRRRKRRIWVAGLCCAVAAATAYALTRPALTMTQQTFCGQEAHTHDESCYETILICGQDEQLPVEQPTPHVHTEDCYAAHLVLVCGQEESEEHTHTEDCYQTQYELICPLEEGETEDEPEIPAHVHTDACYETRLICEKPEHMHSLSCYAETVVLLSHKKADSYIHIDVEFGEGEGKIPVDSIAKRAEAYKPKEKVTYKMIKEYIEAKYGFKVHTAYIAEVKRNLGLPMYDAPNAVEELKQPRKHPTPEKVEAIKDALRYFAVI